MMSHAGLTARGASHSQLDYGARLGCLNPSQPCSAYLRQYWSCEQSRPDLDEAR